MERLKHYTCLIHEVIAFNVHQILVVECEDLGAEGVR